MISVVLNTVQYSTASLGRIQNNFLKKLYTVNVKIYINSWRSRDGLVDSKPKDDSHK